MTLALFERLATALAIGLLLGAERGWRDRDVAEGGRTAGIRTYALMGLLGGVAGLLSQTVGGWALAALGVPLALTLILFKTREQALDQDVSATTVVAGLLVFALGALAMISEPGLAAAAAVAAAGLLAAKPGLHAWLRRLTWEELRGGLVLLAMTLIVLPLLPDRGYGPAGAFNPAELWALTIAMAAVSFVAYGAVRVLGPARGTLLASAAAAVVSSTALTFALARRQRRTPDLAANVGGVMVAGAVMALRLIVIASALYPPLLNRLAVPLGAFAAVSAILGLVVARGGAGGQPASAAAPTLKNPFELDAVLKFAAVLGLVIGAARVATSRFGPAGLLPVAVIGGLADTDAVTLAAARFAREGLDPWLATQAVLVAAMVDSLSKIGLASVVGGAAFGRRVALGTGLAAAAAALAAWVAWR